MRQEQIWTPNDLDALRGCLLDGLFCYYCSGTTKRPAAHWSQQSSSSLSPSSYFVAVFSSYKENRYSYRISRNLILSANTVALSYSLSSIATSGTIENPLRYELSLKFEGSNKKGLPLQSKWYEYVWANGLVGVPSHGAQVLALSSFRKFYVVPVVFESRVPSLALLDLVRAPPYGYFHDAMKYCGFLQVMSRNNPFLHWPPSMTHWRWTKRKDEEAAISCSSSPLLASCGEKRTNSGAFVNVKPPKYTHSPCSNGNTLTSHHSFIHFVEHTSSGSCPCDSKWICSCVIGIISTLIQHEKVDQWVPSQSGIILIYTTSRPWLEIKSKG